MRDTDLRQRDPLREKDINLSHREREQSTDLSEELEAFRFGFEQSQEIKRMGQSEKGKKAPQPIVVVAVAMSKEVELETFGHERVLEERDLRFLEERERKL